MRGHTFYNFVKIEIAKKNYVIMITTIEAEIFCAENTDD